jgi:ATP-dependent protease HslVU (ClpYQ) peptidase subunit
VTLIIGIKCSDGIVVGSDGAVTLSVLGLSTAQQPTKKLQFIKPDTILGVSGTVGIAQQMAGILKADIHAFKLADVLTELRSRIWDKLLKKEFEIAKAAREIHPQMQQECLSCTLLALPVEGKPELISFAESGGSFSASSDLPFIAIGSGQPIADPFLAFIRRIFWEKRIPTIADGIFAVWWTLHHAIKTSPGGVAEPKQIAVLEWKDTGKGKKVPQARELSEAELKEHVEAVMRAEEHLRNFDRQAAREPAPVAAPEMPIPPLKPS